MSCSCSFHLCRRVHDYCIDRPKNDHHGMLYAERLFCLPVVRSGVMRSFFVLARLKVARILSAVEINLLL